MTDTTPETLDDFANMEAVRADNARARGKFEAFMYDEMLAETLRAVAAEKRAAAWQLIATAPLDGTRVLATEDGTPIRVLHYDSEAQIWTDDGDVVEYEPTHWAALPRFPGFSD